MDISESAPKHQTAPAKKRYPWYEFWYKKFILPRAVDEDSARREYLLNIILASSIVMLFAFDIGVLYYSLRSGNDYDGVPFAIFSIIPIFFIFLYLLSRKGRSRAAAYLLIIAYTISESIAAYYWSIRMPEVLLGYAITIFIAGMLISTRFGFFVTGFVAFFAILLDYAQFNHLITTRTRIHINSNGSMVFSVLFLFVMMLSWLSNREIEKSLFRVRESEQELKHERDNLEIAIQKRTQELNQTQLEKIEQIYRFAEFGQLASGIFHDILNILNAVSLHAEDNPTQEHQLAEAFETTKLIENFTQAIRKQLDHNDSLETFSLVEGINQAIQLVSYKANKEKVQIVFHYDHETTFSYFGNSFKFHQVIINLLINAIESYDGLAEHDRRERAIIIDLGENSTTISIHIKDYGCGISAGIREKIFDPFFSTKSGNRGSGIGLATIKKIVEEDLRGTITLTSKEGNGSTFTVVFPMRLS